MITATAGRRAHVTVAIPAAASAAVCAAPIRTPAGHHDVAGADVAASAAHVLAGPDGLRHVHGAPVVDDVLDRHHRVGALGDDGARGDPDRLAGHERASGGATRR